MIEKIYFDLDDTLANFSKGTKKIGFIIDEKKNKVDEDNRMWDMIRPHEHFYQSLKPMEGALDLFQEVVDKFGRDKVEILTGIPKPHRNIKNAKEDKVAWVRKYLSKTVKINIVLRADKKTFCKGLGYILIDDTKNNCKEWEEKGGLAIRYIDPRDTLERLDINYRRKIKNK